MIGIPHRYLTARFSGVGGVIKQSIEDFRVNEVPLYHPADRGEHTYFEVEKFDLSTLEAVERIAAALGIPAREIGFAGLKDRKGITRQVFSIRQVPPGEVLGLRLSQIRVRWARLHLNKLRLGHLRGNRFQIRVRDVTLTERTADLVEGITGVIRRLGLPNYYGPQRFGTRGDTFRIGRALIHREYERAVRRILGHPSVTEKNPLVVLARHRFMRGDVRGALEAFPRSYRLERHLLEYLLRAKDNWRGAVKRIDQHFKRIYFSSLQSYIFNSILDRRLLLSGGVPGKLFMGDLAFLHRNGAVFYVQDLEREQRRAQAFEISPSGPIFGKVMPWPEGLQHRMELEALSRLRLRAADFHQLMPGLHMRGGRRPMRIEVSELRWALEGRDVHFEFFLPRGAYATTFLREVMKNDEPAPAFYSECENGVPIPDAGELLAGEEPASRSSPTGGDDERADSGTEGEIPTLSEDYSPDDGN